MNRLASERSPYLLQHASNPVDWFPWNEEAFARARVEDKPIFLSIGYSTCHWCHVMEHESFENQEIAALLNRDFVSIKVDREERPDVDRVYMAFVQATTGQGGWPMTVFLRPDLKPFFGGTYFPPTSRWGRPGFADLVGEIARVWREDRARVDEAADELTERLRSVALGGRPESEIAPPEALESAVAQYTGAFDDRNGGFGGAPKFPRPSELIFLLREHARTGAQTPLLMAGATLKAMAVGGMRDHIGGGFHRYSVDAHWRVPHFEKMLYDQAQLVIAYLEAAQATGDEFYASVAEDTLRYVLRDMTSPEGGFYSAEDADSEGEEGKFYVWDRAEVLQALGAEEGRAFCALYDITERGNWEGKNILNVPRDPGSVAGDLGITLDQLGEISVRGKRVLYGIRAKRVWPARDEKILAGWNGWMLAAFAEAATAFDWDEYRTTTGRTADFLLTRIDAQGRLTRHARIPGLLEDYSGAAWGLALAFEATHERRYLDAARSLAEQILDRFEDREKGGFFDTPSDHEVLIARPKDMFDNATPAGSSVASDLLLRLSLLLGEQKYADAATRAIEATWPLAERYPSGFGFLLGVAEWRAGQPKEIAITGNDENFRTLRKVVGEHFLPHRVLVAGPGVADLPLMESRDGSKTMAYVCHGYMCQEPTDRPERLAEQLGR